MIEGLTGMFERFFRRSPESLFPVPNLEYPTPQAHYNITSWLNAADPAFRNRLIDGNTPTSDWPDMIADRLENPTATDLNRLTATVGVAAETVIGFRRVTELAEVWQSLPPEHSANPIITAALRYTRHLPEPVFTKLHTTDHCAIDQGDFVPAVISSQDKARLLLSSRPKIQPDLPTKVLQCSCTGAFSADLDLPESPDHRQARVEAILNRHTGNK